MPKFVEAPYIFERSMPERESPHRVVLPEHIEQELLGEAKDAPFGYFFSRLAQAGASNEQLDRFKAAVYAFKDRPAMDAPVLSCSDWATRIRLVSF